MINPINGGLVFGAIIGLWHLTWSLLVAAGWAQPVIDFVFWMHFIKPVYVIQPYKAGLCHPTFQSRDRDCPRRRDGGHWICCRVRIRRPVESGFTNDHELT